MCFLHVIQSNMFTIWNFSDSTVVVSCVVVLFTVCALIFSTKYTYTMIMKTNKSGKKDGKMEKITEMDGETEDVQSDDSYDKLSSDKIDPVSYCEHIQGEVKRVKQKVTNQKLQEGLSKEQIQDEKTIQLKQLEEIFKLMETQPDKFGPQSRSDVSQQMSLYA